MTSSRNYSAFTFLIFSILFIACNGKTNNETEDATQEVFTVVEELPSYEGGLESYYYYVKNEIKYPKDARDKGIEGKVDVEFVIERDGSISNVKTLNGIGSGCDQEAERVVANSPNFIPGNQRGRTVRVRMVLPIVFKLDPGAKNPDGSSQGMVIIEEASINKQDINVDAAYSDGKWTGTISATSGEALPGANIVISGTTSGTVSGLDGTFEIEASESSEVIISFVGYKSTKLAEN